MAEQTERTTNAGYGDALLEQALRRLGAQVVYPSTPPIARAVRQRLVVQPRRQPPFWQRALESLVPTWPPTPAPMIARATLVVLLLIAALTLAVSPSARQAVARGLGLPGVAIKYVPFLPAAPTPTSEPAPAALGARLGLGQPATLAEAQGKVGFTIRVPAAALGQPEEVYVSPSPPGGQVTLVYRTRAGLPPSAAASALGLLLTEFRGDLQIDSISISKMLGTGTRLERVTVNGRDGYWIEGRPHLVFFRDTTGQQRTDSVRSAGNTLLWEHDNLVLRLESALPKDEALRIASSIR